MAKAIEQVHLVLGSQLFSVAHLKSQGIHPGTGQVLFMRESPDLCTFVKHHQQKVVFFLAAMRTYAEELRKAGYQVHYEKIEDTWSKKVSYVRAFSSFLSEAARSGSLPSVTCFEIEDRWFERALLNAGLSIRWLPSPMFLTSRPDWSRYWSERPLRKSPQTKMADFYIWQRKRLNLLLDAEGQPLGGAWSFDAENRQKLPKNYQAPELPKVTHSDETREVIRWVGRTLTEHPGQASETWLPVDRSSAERWLEDFIQHRLIDFGPYEDAFSAAFPFLNHSVLTPFLNCGLLTPQQVVDSVTKVQKRRSGLPIASVEGFVRQVIGWREFVRGIDQRFGERQSSQNHWNHYRPLNQRWYTGETGIEPLDQTIKKAQRYAYTHHIERLMVLGNLMLLLEIDPREAYRWFMEMFIDSADWVMGPNVYGMALTSDGGVFATKPYICGSNYYRKMGDFGRGDWESEVDGLYWGFVGKHAPEFLKNPRTAMSVRTYQRMDRKKRVSLEKAADQARERIFG